MARIDPDGEGTGVTGFTHSISVLSVPSVVSAFAGPLLAEIFLVFIATSHA